MSAPDSAAVIMTGINLALAALLLAAIVWRVGSRTVLGSLIVGAGAGFALAVAPGQMGRSAGTPPDSLEKRIAGIESNIAELSQPNKGLYGLQPDDVAKGLRDPWILTTDIAKWQAWLVFVGFLTLMSAEVTTAGELINSTPPTARATRNATSG